MQQFEIFHLQEYVSVDGLVNVSYYHLPNNFSWPGEAHEPWELVYVDQGDVLVTAGENRYKLKAGEMAVHCPNEFHNLYPYENSSANVIIITFLCTGPVMDELEHKILTLGKTEKQYLSWIVKESEASFAYFKNTPPQIRLLLREDAPFGGQQIIKNLLECFLLLVQRHSNSIGFEERAIPINQMHQHMRIAAQIQNYIHDHYAEKITLDLLAEQNRVSVTQLKRIFKEQTGNTVIAYLISYRMEEAKRLVQESNLNFSQIANQVGYDNIYYFSNAFKHYTGMTLTEYSNSLLH